MEKIVEKIQIVHQPVRQKLPRSRRGRTFEFRVADCKGFATIGEYDTGQPGEQVLVAHQGAAGGRRDGDPDEHRGEAQHEQQGAEQHRAAPLALQVDAGQPGDVAEVAGHERQHAR